MGKTPRRGPEPAAAASTALSERDALLASGLNVRKAVSDYVMWYFGGTIPESRLQNLKAKLADIGIDAANLTILAHVFARHVLDHKEWNVDPAKLKRFTQAKFVADMKGKTLGGLIAYLVNLVTKAAQ